MKHCTKCREAKDESLFDKQSRAKDGRKPICKSCAKTLNRERYLRLERKIIEQVRAWQKENPEKVAAAKAKYRNKTSP